LAAFGFRPAAAGCDGWNEVSIESFAKLFVSTR
jgi:hypothetical protein